MRCSYSLNDSCQAVDDYNPNKKHKILIVFGDIIADVLSNKKLEPTVTEMLFVIDFLDISLVFITQSFVDVPRNIRLNLTSFIMKIPNRCELPQIASKLNMSVLIRLWLKMYNVLSLWILEKIQPKTFNFQISAQILHNERNLTSESVI